VDTRCNCMEASCQIGRPVFSLQPPSVGRETLVWSLLRKARQPRSSQSCPVPTRVPLRPSGQAAALGRKIIWLRLALAPHHQPGHEVFLRARRRLSSSSIFCCSHSVTRRPPSLPLSLSFGTGHPPPGLLQSVLSTHPTTARSFLAASTDRTSRDSLLRCPNREHVSASPFRV
jgi:hypothetical protein